MANGEKFRKFLESEFERRKLAKTDFSIRSFAKELDVDYSFLAKLINGSRAFTPLTLRRLGPQFKLSNEQNELFLEDILRKQAGGRIQAKRNKVLINPVSPERFNFISEWHYTAILVLMSLKKFSPKPAWIAKQLGIPTSVAAHAMNLLESHRYFFRDEKGRCIVAEVQNTVHPSADTNLHLKRYQKQVLLKSIAAVDEVPLDKRDHSCITIATTSKRIEQAKPMIRTFRRKLMKYLEDVESPNIVYVFATSLFPLTKEIES
jgi:uncharacterized protein (TIGR02147 family)